MMNYQLEEKKTMKYYRKISLIADYELAVNIIKLTYLS
jgi:hypothetical protein